MRIATVLDALSRRNLTREEMTEIFRHLMTGEYNDIEVSGLVCALKARGETPEEIAGAASALRAAALPFPAPDYRYADTCGTGGDGTGTVNVSTAVAIVTAEMGLPVAKHGNRSVSSQCGSADVLEAVGVRLDPSPEVARQCLDEVGVCFLFAPQYHAGVRHAMPVRKTLATRTIFNVLGPLSNPSHPVLQLMGVYDPSLCRPLAVTLGLLGCEAALVVHGEGLDEIALHGVTTAALWKDGRVTELEFTPEEAGLARHDIAALRGGDPAHNAKWLRGLLGGGNGVEPAHRAAVAVNAGALAWIAGLSDTLGAGVEIALDAIDSGRCADRLDQWVKVSQGA